MKNNEIVRAGAFLKYLSTNFLPVYHLSSENYLKEYRLACTVYISTDNYRVTRLLYKSTEEDKKDRGDTRLQRSIGRLLIWPDSPNNTFIVMC